MPAPLTRRRLLELLGTASALPLLPACSQAQTAPAAKPPLIVYLSRTRNTETIARMIQQYTGGELFEIRTAVPYPENYQATVDQVQQENNRNDLPPLAGPLPDFSRYDTVFIGFPTWGMQLPPPMKSFLSSARLRHKTILPFNTHAPGFGVGSGFETVRTMSPQNTVLSGLSITGGYERRGILLAIEGEKARAAEAQVASWLSQHHIPKEG